MNYAFKIDHITYIACLYSLSEIVYVGITRTYNMVMQICITLL